MNAISVLSAAGRLSLGESSRSSFSASFTPVGVWTGPVLGAWLAGTQRVWRGFVLMVGFALLFGLPHLVAWPSARQLWFRARVPGLDAGGHGAEHSSFYISPYGESTVAGMVFDSSIAHFWRPIRDDCWRMATGWLCDGPRRKTKPAAHSAPCLEAEHRCSSPTGLRQR